MKLTRISFLFLLFFLFVPSLSYAQNAANKNWQSYWTKFTTAVKNKNLKALKALSQQKPFHSGGGLADTFDEFFQVDKKELNDTWKWLAKGVKSGTKEHGKLSRITRDEFAIFEYSKKGWRWVGIMGD